MVEPTTRRVPGRRLGVAAAIVAGLLTVLAGFGPSARPTAAAAYDRFYANFAGEELMRAINADRAALGRAALAPDPALARVARDRSTTCPSNAGLTIRGRARDMAERGYLTHSVKGCLDAGGGAFSAFDLLASFGHTWSSIGENIASNTYPFSKADYATGCSASGSGCDGTIQLPWTVAVAARGWMSSTAHRAAILSTTFERFGCAAWAGSGGTRVYACYFAAGGNATPDSSGPVLSEASGAGATFSVGATPTFTVLADDAASLLSDGRALLDGQVIADWAHDHDGSSERLSVRTPPLQAGNHTLTWRERDTSMNTRVLTIEFAVAGGPGPTPTAPPATPSPPSPSQTAAPKPSATVDVDPTQTARPAVTPRASASVGPEASAVGSHVPSPGSTATGGPLPEPGPVHRPTADPAEPLGDGPAPPRRPEQAAIGGRPESGAEWIGPAITLLLLLVAGFLAGRPERAARRSGERPRGLGGGS